MTVYCDRIYYHQQGIPTQVEIIVINNYYKKDFDNLGGTKQH